MQPLCHDTSLLCACMRSGQACTPTPAGCFELQHHYQIELTFLKLICGNCSFVGSTVVNMSNAVTVQKHSNASSHLGVDVCPATNALHHSFASRMHGQHLPNPLTLRRGRRAVVLLTLMVQLRGLYSLKKMIQSFNLQFRYT